MDQTDQWDIKVRSVLTEKQEKMEPRESKEIQETPLTVSRENPVMLAKLDKRAKLDPLVPMVFLSRESLVTWACLDHLA